MSRATCRWWRAQIEIAQHRAVEVPETNYPESCKRALELRCTSLLDLAKDCAEEAIAGLRDRRETFFELCAAIPQGLPEDCRDMLVDAFAMTLGGTNETPSPIEIRDMVQAHE